LARIRTTTTIGPGAGSPAGDDSERWDAEAPAPSPWQPGEAPLRRSGYQIVLGRDRIVTLTQAAALIPPRRRGRKTSVSTLFRWSTSGCRGVILPTLQVGGSRCTSAQAMQWFCEVLTELSHDLGGKAGAADLPLRRSPSRRQRESEAAGKRLEQMGA
jgi:Protein of unknown function (DUF1580)